MADYYTQFSFEIPFKPEQHCKVVEFLQTRDERADELEETDPEAYLEDYSGFNYTLQGESVWISSSDDSGNVEGAIELTMGVLDALDSDDLVLIEWANTCSKLRLDSFSGGAILVSREGAQHDCIPWQVLTQKARDLGKTIIGV